MGMGSPRDSLSLVTAAVDEPVTLAEVKSQLRIDYSDEDTLLASYIKAATLLVEKDLNRDIMEKTWDFIMDDFPAYSFHLPISPAQSITSITYTDANGNTGQTVSTSVYGSDLALDPGLVFLKQSQSWPEVYDEPRSVTVRFVTGYSGTADSPVSRTNVPESVRIAILMLVADMHRNREAQVTRSVGLETNPVVSALLAPYRVNWL